MARVTFYTLGFIGLIILIVAAIVLGLGWYLTEGTSYEKTFRSTAHSSKAL